MPHSKAPWSVRRLTEKPYMADIENELESIASVELWSHGNAGDPATCEANARLIAAAPELFEACQAIQYESDRTSGHDILVSKQRFAMVTAALAKALGGRPITPEVSLIAKSPKKCSACAGTGVKTDDNGVQEDDVCPRCEGSTVEPEGE